VAEHMRVGFILVGPSLDGPWHRGQPWWLRDG
jgi:hypothetical protein